MDQKNDALGNQLTTIRETASMALAAQAEAEVKARFAMAKYSPRNQAQFRVQFLAACKRKQFADLKTAVYTLERWDSRKGEKVLIQDAGIALIDEAIKFYGNVSVDTVTVHDDENMRMIKVIVTDLETNLTKSDTITISKTMERRKLRKGQEAISSRTNSEGVKTYTVRASESDLWPIEKALVAKARRNVERQLMPRDIIDEGVKTILETRLAQAVEDPEAERRKVYDAFAEIGIRPADLEKHLGHSLDTISPAEIVDLRGLYASIRDGHTVWAEVIAEDEEPEAEEKPKKPSPAEKIKKAVDKKKSKTKAKPKPAPEPEPKPEPKPADERKSFKQMAEEAKARANAEVIKTDPEVVKYRAKAEAMAKQLDSALFHEILDEAVKKVTDGNLQSWADARDYETAWNVCNELASRTGVA